MAYHKDLSSQQRIVLKHYSKSANEEESYLEGYPLARRERPGRLRLRISDFFSSELIKYHIDSPPTNPAIRLEAYDHYGNQKECEEANEQIDLDDEEFIQAYKDDNPTDDFLRYEQNMREEALFNLYYEE